MSNTPPKIAAHDCNQKNILTPYDFHHSTKYINVDNVITTFLNKFELIRCQGAIFKEEENEFQNLQFSFMKNASGCSHLIPVLFLLYYRSHIYRKSVFIFF